MVQVHSSDVRSPVGWQTSATFQSEIYSGDFERYDKAFRRFVDVNLDQMLAVARRRVPLDRVEEVVQDALLKLHRQIWEKGWIHPPGTRFRQCVNQLARDAAIDTLRSATRRQQVGDNQPAHDVAIEDLQGACAQWIDGFMRQEILVRAESMVRMAVSSAQWDVYVAWKARSGFTAVNQAWLEEDPRPLSGKERVTILRIRQKLREEIESLAQREGWSIEELFVAE